MHSLSSWLIGFSTITSQKTHQPLQKRDRARTMNFSSIPAYLDPANWQQQSNHPLGGSSGTSSQLLPSQPVPSLPSQPHQSQVHGAVSTGSTRPGSMADRARMANIPVPETALKCPRCESTNTKFCYFNNYSLSQPRHFCKTCRRYWTRGGALRSVPVGGGCRRNKRSKASSSKSPASSDRQTGSTAGSTNSISSNTGTTAELLGLASHHIPPLRFMAPMSHLTEFAAGEMGLSYGLSYNPVSAPVAGINDFTFQIGNALGGNGVSVGGGTGSLMSASGFDHQWKLQQTRQFPLLAGLETSTGLYPFEGHGVDASLYGGGISHIRPKPTSTSGLISQMASVKMEESQEMNLSRQLFGINNNQLQATDHQYWTNGTNTTWTDLSANFSSSSTTSNHL